MNRQVYRDSTKKPCLQRTPHSAGALDRRVRLCSLLKGTQIHHRAVRHTGTSTIKVREVEQEKMMFEGHLGRRSTPCGSHPGVKQSKLMEGGK